ncbi:hypothetical protein [Actinoplanes xinjiangensis]|uniref:hypothetical protein n=1 Tax=Actinoplanes xinjiangensis TaxID=512350 RepID=UPI003414CA01
MSRTALSVAEDAFRLLVCEPGPLVFDGRSVSGLPGRLLPLDELRSLLVAGCATEVSDAVWRHLAVRAREDGPVWVVGAVGVALPGLTRMAVRLSARAPRLADDVISEVLTGFLVALRTADLGPPRVWLRLCWAAWRAGNRAREVDDLLELPADVPVGSRSPRRPYGHPDIVLSRAVQAGVITVDQADLIGATRLGDVLVEQIAAASGESGSVVRMRRRRAELKLVAALRRGDLALPAVRSTGRPG